MGIGTKFKNSSAAYELFGQEFVEHFAASREWEEREFRKHITDWELDRYFVNYLIETTDFIKLMD